MFAKPSSEREKGRDRSSLTRHASKKVVAQWIEHWTVNLNKPKFKSFYILCADIPQQGGIISKRSRSKVKVKSYVALIGYFLFSAIFPSLFQLQCKHLEYRLTGVSWPSWQNNEVKGQSQGHEGHETLKTLKLQYLPIFGARASRFCIRLLTSYAHHMASYTLC